MFWNYSTGRFFLLALRKKNALPPNYRIYHLIKQIREHFFYPEMWSISQKTNLKKQTCF